MELDDLLLRSKWQHFFFPKYLRKIEILVHTRPSPKNQGWTTRADHCDIFAARYEALLLVTTVASKQDLMTENQQLPRISSNYGRKGYHMVFLQRMTNLGRHGLR